MSLPHIFNAKVVDDEHERNGSPLVSPQARSEGALVVPAELEALGEEVVGKFAGLFETVDPLWISKYTHPLYAYSVSVYSSMNSVGMSVSLMRTYSGRSMGVPR